MNAKTSIAILGAGNIGTAIAVQASMTCLSSNGCGTAVLDSVKESFDTVGKTLTIDEEEMNAATALGASGMAFFLRAIRASSHEGSKSYFILKRLY